LRGFNLCWFGRGNDLQHWLYCSAEAQWQQAPLRTTLSPRFFFSSGQDGLRQTLSLPQDPRQSGWPDWSWSLPVWSWLIAWLGLVWFGLPGLALVFYLALALVLPGSGSIWFGLVLVLVWFGSIWLLSHFDLV
jgi:hypothetical protein